MLVSSTIIKGVQYNPNMVNNRCTPFVLSVMIPSFCRFGTPPLKPQSFVIQGEMRRFWLYFSHKEGPFIRHHVASRLNPSLFSFAQFFQEWQNRAVP